MIGWGVRVLMAGFCLALTLAKLKNGHDITLSATATVCWSLSALLRLMSELERYRAQHKPIEHARTQKKGRK